MALTSLSNKMSKNLRIKIIKTIEEIFMIFFKLLTLRVEDKNVFAKRKYINQETFNKPDKCILASKKYIKSRCCDETL